MTFEELYEYGRNSEPAMACIPKELVQSLPRLERINGIVVVQYWSFFQNVSIPWNQDTPLYYAAFDIKENKLVEMKALTDEDGFMQSWQDLIFWSREMREVKYLEHCAMLLERGNITEAEIIHTQAMWLDAQAKNIFVHLYYASGVRPEAVQELLSQYMAEKSRYLLWIWNVEVDKYRTKKAEGYEQLDAIWNDPIFEKERRIFYDLRGRGPMKGMRMKEEY